MPTLQDQLRASLAVRKTIRTVGDFLDALFASGVRVNDDLNSIEFGVSQLRTGRVDVERDEYGAIDVREARS